MAAPMVAGHTAVAAAPGEMLVTSSTLYGLQPVPVAFADDNGGGAAPTAVVVVAGCLPNKSGRDVAYALALAPSLLSSGIIMRVFTADTVPINAYIRATDGSRRSLRSVLNPDALAHGFQVHGGSTPQLYAAVCKCMQGGVDDALRQVALVRCLQAVEAGERSDDPSGTYWQPWPGVWQESLGPCLQEQHVIDATMLAGRNVLWADAAGAAASPLRAAVPAASILIGGFGDPAGAEDPLASLAPDDDLMWMLDELTEELTNDDDNAWIEAAVGTVGGAVPPPPMLEATSAAPPAPMLDNVNMVCLMEALNAPASTAGDVLVRWRQNMQSNMAQLACPSDVANLPNLLIFTCDGPVRHPVGTHLLGLAMAAYSATAIQMCFQAPGMHQRLPFVPVPFCPGDGTGHGPGCCSQILSFQALLHLANMLPADVRAVLIGVITQAQHSRDRLMEEAGPVQGLPG